MKRSLAIALSGSTSFLALCGAPIATAQQAAQADQPAASNSVGLEEIVVTARRKEEKAQSVPIAISNVTAVQLEDQRILQPNDVLKNVTGVQIFSPGTKNVLGSNVGGGFGNGYQWVRGIPGLVPYWADVPTIASGGLLFDIASVQVLKGPQGTLFGQATNGGAFLYQPKLPTNNFEGYVQAEVGDFGHTRLEGIVNIPILDDKLLVRVGGRTNHTDGFVYDIAHKLWLGSEGSQDGRLAITFRPTDDIQNDFIGNAYHYNDVPGIAQYRSVNPAVLAGLNPYASLAPNTCGVTAACLITYSGPLGWYAVPGNANNPAAPMESGYFYNLVNTTRWDVLDNLTVKNILGYTEGGPGTGYSASPVTLSYAPSAFGQDIHSWPSGAGIQGSEEFQILGRLLDDKLSFTAGGIVLYNQGSTAPHVINIQCARVTLNGVQNGGIPSACSGTVTFSTDRAWGIYAQGTYDFSNFLDGLSFTGGVRYTWDQAYGSVYQYLGTPQNGAIKQTVTGVAAGWAQGEESKAASYNMSLDWQIDPKTLLYVSNSKGFSRGGLNLTATLTPGPGRVYQPESLNNVEAGIKADWDLPLDMKARTNVSLFYGFYDNIQVSANTPILDTFGNPSTAVLTANAAVAHIEGIDLDLTLIPTDSITVSIGAVESLLKYENWPYCAAFVGAGAAAVCAPGQLYDLKDASALYNPRWTWNARVSYVLPFDESIGKITLMAVLNHIDPSYGNAGFNPPTPGWPSAPPQDLTSASNNVDLSLSWARFLGRDGLDAHAGVTNLFNGHWGGGQNNSNYYPSGATTYYVTAPRMWTVGVKYAFGP